MNGSTGRAGTAPAPDPGTTEAMFGMLADAADPIAVGGRAEVSLSLSLGSTSMGGLLPGGVSPSSPDGPRALADTLRALSPPLLLTLISSARSEPAPTPTPPPCRLRVHRGADPPS
jgi:hypothetical protein